MSVRESLLNEPSASAVRSFTLGLEDHVERRLGGALISCRHYHYGSKQTADTWFTLR